MNSRSQITRAAGIAGIVAGLGLALEFGLFMASGWTPESRAAWGGFDAFLDAAGGVGYVFAGVAYAAAGWATYRRVGSDMPWDGSA